MNNTKHTVYFDLDWRLHYVDNNFVKESDGSILHSSLKDLGNGDFLLWTPNGDITFRRTDDLDKYDNVPTGDYFYMYDDQKGNLVKKVMKALNCKTKKLNSILNLL